MTLDPNEIIALKLSEAQLEGEMNALANAGATLSRQNQAAGQKLQEVRRQLSISDPNPTARPVTGLDNAANTERVAGLRGVKKAVMANPQLTESGAFAAFETAALQARPANRQWLVHSAQGLLREYAANLLDVGQVRVTTWLDGANGERGVRSYVLIAEL